jgi:hypothetical protein
LVYGSDVDTDWSGADPDPAFYLNAVPDAGFAITLEVNINISAFPFLKILFFYLLTNLM